jgi:hypothetical protein
MGSPVDARTAGHPIHPKDLSDRVSRRVELSEVFQTDLRCCGSVLAAAIGRVGEVVEILGRRSPSAVISA